MTIKQDSIQELLEMHIRYKKAFNFPEADKYIRTLIAVKSLISEHAQMKALLSSMGKYLDTNKLTNIPNGCQFHLDIKEIASKYGDESNE